MINFFETIILLSLTGSASVIMLLLLKLVLLKRFSGNAQKALWVLALLSMLIPVWKFIPEESIEPIIIPYYNNYNETRELTNISERETMANNEEEHEFTQKPKLNLDYEFIFAVILICGASVFVTMTIISYLRFLVKKKKNSVDCTENTVLEKVKEGLNIKRKIRVRKCRDSDSPFLTGVVFPIIYIPEDETDEKNLELIFLHELTHYKNKDLLLKWVAFFVNAIHWFNPFCYIITKNINEACEIACDMSVTKNMDNDEKKRYMETILNLLSRRG